MRPNFRSRTRQPVSTSHARISHQTHDQTNKQTEKNRKRKINYEERKINRFGKKRKCRYLMNKRRNERVCVCERERDRETKQKTET